jgi:putative glutamine amidotransferase
MAYAADGIIEAVRMPEKRFVWAVQWHPEAFWEETGMNLELFKKLVAASRR